MASSRPLQNTLNGVSPHPSAPYSAALNGGSPESFSTVSQYAGQGTPQDPFVVDWDERDPDDPRQWTKTKRWFLTLLLAFSTWNVSFAASSYSGSLIYILTAFHASEVVVILGGALYVAGLGFGPLLFAPLSEIYGRRIVFLCTYAAYLLFLLGCALATNVQTIVICRFFAGLFGSAPLSNSGGQISDMWSPRDRGPATALYSLCTFFGPVSGPVIGGFVSQSFHNGWRINFWVMFGISGSILLLAFLTLAETYPSVLLRRRANLLHAESGRKFYYISVLEKREKITKREFFFLSLRRPLVFLVKEPIVTCISVYIGIAYASLCVQFVVFPIVFQIHRHFTPGNSGLAFIGITIGQLIALASAPLQSRFYWRAMDGGGKILPEARLFGAIAGSIALPFGMFWFSWSISPSISPSIPILSGIPFGMGIVLVISNLNAYLMDTYSLHCTSALASTILLRSLFGAMLQLLSPTLFEALSDEWACTLFAFIALAGAPVPILFYKYGDRMRSRSANAFP